MGQFFYPVRGIQVAVVAAAASFFPGQAGNPVGYTAAPGFSSLTPWPGGTGNQTVSNGTHATGGSGTSGDPWIFQFFDFDGVAGGTVFTLANAKFIGCRFQSNDVANYNTQVNGGTNLTFSYCSFTPRTSIATSPPNAAWPSSGAGLQTTTQDASNSIGGNSGYQYGMNCSNPAGGDAGPITIDHCDFWGFGNGGPIFYSSTSQMTVSDCWIHDAANASPQTYHIDGTGYLNGATPCHNVAIIHCTIATIGNTNAIAFQAGTSAYTNISVTDCYFSGYQNCVDIGHNLVGNTNLTFTDNTFGTDLPWSASALYTNFAAQFTGSTNVWRRNKIKVLAGTSPVGGSTPTFSGADDGKYMLPSITLSTTDFSG